MRANDQLIFVGAVLLEALFGEELSPHLEVHLSVGVVRHVVNHAPSHLSVGSTEGDEALCYFNNRKVDESHDVPVPFTDAVEGDGLADVVVAECAGVHFGLLLVACLFKHKMQKKVFQFFTKITDKWLYVFSQ